MRNLSNLFANSKLPTITVSLNLFFCVGFEFDLMSGQIIIFMQGKEVGKQMTSERNCRIVFIFLSRRNVLMQYFLCLFKARQEFDALNIAVPISDTHVFSTISFFTRLVLISLANSSVIIFKSVL